MTDSQKSDDAYRWVWGKTDRRGQSRRQGGADWNPLLAHLLDTAAAASALWDRYLAPAVRARLTEAFGAGDEHTARAVTAFYAALHDLGKASPAFLHQFGRGRYSSLRLRKAREAWEKAARSAGLPLPTDWATAWWARHEHVTAVALPHLTGCDCPPNDICIHPGHRGLQAAAYCLGAHHGSFPSSDTVEKAYGATGPEWTPIHQDLVQAVAELTGVETPRLISTVNLRRPSALIAFAGLVVLSDWLASDENRFAYRRTTDPQMIWWQNSRQESGKAVADLRLECWPTTPVTWEDIWPGTQPRPFQADAMSILPESGPAMIMVESDTGSGKTRLALWCAHHLATRNGYQGLYMAMPTRAATNQITTEIEGFMAKTVSSPAANLAVVHGTAFATDIVHRLIDAAQPPAPAQAPGGIEDLLGFVLGTLEGADHERTPEADTDTTPSSRAVLDPWYLRRCLGLVSPFGIGTIDQVVLSAQRSRHWFVRLFGLMNKTVIIDEAHAYELYQQDLLMAAVEWLADAGASLVVLSATLPSSIREGLSRAWCAGLRVDPRDLGEQGPITVIDGTGKIRRAGPSVSQAPALDTTITLEADPGPAQLSAQLLTRAAQGGCIGVVRTRVASAVALYEQVRAQATRHGWRSDEIILIHGRFMPRDRQPLEATLTTRLGPGPDETRSLGRANPNRPERLLVIATQVIEQSLDLDFDHLVTDLAPIDLLIQRRGRLHRHTVNNPGRRPWCSEPGLRILYRPDPDYPNLPLVTPPRHRGAGNADGFVYDPYVLAATYRALHDRRSPDELVRISTPRDSTALIEAVYGPRQDAPDPAWEKLLEDTWAKWQESLDKERGWAKDRMIRPYYGPRRTPVSVKALASGEDHGDGDEGGVEGIRAVSRLADPSVTAIFLYRQDKGTLTYDPSGHIPADLADHTNAADAQELAEYRQQQRDLLLNTIAIPSAWFRGRSALPAVETWPRFDQPALKHSHVILLNPTGHCVSGPTGRLAYSSTTGLAKL